MSAGSPGRALLSIAAHGLSPNGWRAVEQIFQRGVVLIERRDTGVRRVWFDRFPGVEAEQIIDAAVEAFDRVTAESNQPPTICIAFEADDPKEPSDASARLDGLVAIAASRGKVGILVVDPIPRSVARSDALAPGTPRDGDPPPEWREVDVARWRPNVMAQLDLSSSEPDDETESEPPQDFWVPPDCDHQFVGAPHKTAKPGTAGDTVIATIFAPPVVAPREPFLVQVFAHLPEDAAQAAALATETDIDTSRRVLKSLSTPVKRGEALTFHLSIPGAEIPAPVASLPWHGRPEAVQFEVTVADDSKKQLIGTVVASLGSVPIGHLKFTLRNSWFNAPPRATGDDAVRYHTAFVSYASQDRNEVLSRVQMLAPLGIGFFQDVMNLEPGARWERELYRHIDECDLFLLFWSKAARDSEWVRKEVSYAIARRGASETGPPAILPVIIEGPPHVRPPPELSHLHFDDRVLYFRSRK